MADMIPTLTGYAPPVVDTSEKDYKVPRKLIQAAKPVTRKLWRAGKILDQGNTSTCVEASFRGFGRASPVRQEFAEPYGAIYDWCQRHDEWAGQDYEGTSVHAVMDYALKNGIVESYEWARNVDELEAHLLIRGCAIAGTTWTWDMFQPDRWGYIRPGGGNAGGHAWLIRGVDTEKGDPLSKIRGRFTKRGAFIKRGSWGLSWGDQGEALVARDDMAALIEDYGEIALPIEIKPTA